MEISASTTLSDPINHAAALAPYLWLLTRADGDGLPLTAAGYLKPADVRALAEVLPTMCDWPFPMAREINVRPVWAFREHLMAVGLLRKYKGTLRLSRMGRVVLADPSALWRHLANILVIPGPGFESDASVVVLVHAATTEGAIDMDTIARTVTELGWSHDGGDAIESLEMYPVWPCSPTTKPALRSHRCRRAHRKSA